MGESFSSEGGDQARRPPSLDQYRAIRDLIRALSPDTTAWEYIDDEGGWNVVLVRNYEGKPHPDEPKTLAFINHVDARRPPVPVLYRLQSEPSAPEDEGLYLRVEVSDNTAIDAANDVTEKLARMNQKIESSGIAAEIGADAASATQAQQLIDVLRLAVLRGVVYM